MQAVKGFFADGRFTPVENIKLPHHAHAILILEELSQKKTVDNFWHEFDRLVDASAHEEMPEFSRFNLGREPITFTEE